MSEAAGKRVSWVELYLDLVFVLAAGQLAHLMVASPRAGTMWIALGLFFALWWTWIGFAVLYNRHGADTPRQHLLFLAGSVPAGVAAAALEPASTGESGVFAASLAATRVILAGAQSSPRVARAYGVSALLFVVSIWVPEPWRYVLWGIAISLESGAVLQEDRAAARQVRERRDLAALAPRDPRDALDAHHFAERFGLFLIILLGEVVIEAGQASVEGHVADAGGWAALVAAMVLAGALWWLYFDAAAEINLRVLALSGGSPTVARAIFAAGQMLPAFSLLMIAAGVGLLLEEDAEPFGFWVAGVGLGLYLVGTRAFLAGTRRFSGAARVVALVATFQLGRLHELLSPHAYVWLLAAWAVACAALARPARDVSGAL